MIKSLSIAKWLGGFIPAAVNEGSDQIECRAKREADQIK
jgi:hypothetical protein